MTSRRMLMQSASHVNSDGMITDSWSKFIKICQEGKAQQYYSLGNYIPLDLGSHGTIDMEILAFNPAWPRADMSSLPNIALFGKTVLNDQFSISARQNDLMNENSQYYKLFDTVFSYLPDWLQEAVVPIKKNYWVGAQNTYSFTWTGSIRTAIFKCWSLSQTDYNSNDALYYPGLLSTANIGLSTKLKRTAASGVAAKWGLIDLYQTFTDYGSKWYETIPVLVDGLISQSTGNAPVYLPLGFCL